LIRFANWIRFDSIGALVWTVCRLFPPRRIVCPLGVAVLVLGIVAVVSSEKGTLGCVILLIVLYPIVGCPEVVLEVVVPWARSGDAIFKPIVAPLDGARLLIMFRGGVGC
jgi:hypothetical protein